MKECNFCGTENRDDAIFCDYCGHRLSADPELDKVMPDEECVTPAEEVEVIDETEPKEFIPEVGMMCRGKVTRIMNFGAFVEIAPSYNGLIHISKLDMQRVNRVEDVVKIGDMVLVKIIEIDEQGRLNLSRRDALVDLLEKRAEMEADK